GAQPDPTTGARATPIYQTTSFVFDDVDHAASLFGLQAFGNIYTRIGNPTSAVLEERVAALEGGTAGLAVASGHAAQVIVMHALMRPGEEFVASRKLYGGSINQFNHAFKNFDWNVVWADPDDIGSFERAINQKTKAIFIESIANPGGVITDIEAIAAVAKRAWVSYAGLPADRYNKLAKKYCPKGAGAVLTFGVKGGYDAGVKVVSNVKLFSHLANIGDTRSLIIHPASTTHRQLTDAQRVQAGAGADVVRLSIGLEDRADIIADLEQALAAA